MLRSLKSILSYRISAKDGEVGKIKDFLFDDESWMIRYLEVDIGAWLVGRRVLLSPHVLGQPDWRQAVVPVDLTKGQVESSPEIDTEQPVSRQREIALHQHYGWPYYWVAGGVWPVPMTPPQAPVPDFEIVHEPLDGERGDPHLQSMHDVLGYHIHATDGSIGHLDDIITDTDAWGIRYLVVDTHNWVPGKKVLLSPQWLVGPIVWQDSVVEVSMTREEIRNSPEYEPSAPVNLKYESRLYDYYGRPGYWKKGEADLAGKHH